MHARSLIIGALFALVGCGSSPPHQHSQSRPAPAQPSPVVPAPDPPPARDCRQLTHEAYGLLNGHTACTADSDCTMTQATCAEQFSCGRAVRASDVTEVNRMLAELAPQLEAQCGRCASAQLSCHPNPICRDGSCVHEAPEGSCDQLERDATALLQAHNACSSADDCVFARDEGGCPPAFACTAVVNKRNAEAFIPLASALSRTYHAHCGRCMRHVAECQAATPVCTDGHCSRR